MDPSPQPKENGSEIESEPTSPDGSSMPEQSFTGPPHDENNHGISTQKMVENGSGGEKQQAKENPNEIESEPTSPDGSVTDPIHDENNHNSSNNNNSSTPKIGENGSGGGKPDGEGDENINNGRSKWECLPTTKSKKRKSNKKKDSSIISNGNNSNAAGSTNGGSKGATKAEYDEMVVRLGKHLKSMKEDFQKLKDYEGNLDKSIKTLEKNFKSIITEVPIRDDRSDSTQQQPPPPPPQPQQEAAAAAKPLRTKKRMRKLKRVSKDIMILRRQIPSLHKLYSEKNSSLQNWEVGNDYDSVEDLPNLHKNDKFLSSLAFKECQQLYEQLDVVSKLCLLCFAVFPENEVIKKRILTYWWYGEGFLDSFISEQKTVEKAADEIIHKLVEKGFIEPIYRKRKRVADSFKMYSLVHSAVVILADRAGFFHYDSAGKPTEESEGCNRKCLVKAEEQDPDEQPPPPPPPKPQKELSEEEKEKLQEKLQVKLQETLQVLFNVNESLLDFPAEYLSKMKHLNVLHLGRWQSSRAHHVEVESTDFFKGLRSTKLLRFLSLQGMSRISELPEDCFSKLGNLRVLDFRACHNLEVLPDGMGKSLKKLTHLDISECYLLDRVPKDVALLSELQVLKGFVIGQVVEHETKICMLKDLAGLTKLRKLTITTNKRAFPTNADIIALQKLESLTKLTIAWGHEHSHAEPAADEKSGTGQEDKGENKRQGNAGAGAEAEAKTVAAPKQSLLKKLGIRAVQAASTGTGQGDKGENKNVGAGAEAEAATPKLSVGKTLTRSGPPVSEGTDHGDKHLGSKIIRTVTMAIGGKSGEDIPDNVALLPMRLEKLDLQCCPLKNSPVWLRPRFDNKLHRLKKLYIRGGNLRDVGRIQEGDRRWESVETFRVKYLSNLKMDWKEMQASFPKLKYLEKVGCPKVTFCPCNVYGVWVKKPEAGTT